MGYRIALVPGDGIGNEVIPEGARVLQKLAGAFGFTIEFIEFPYSCAYYLKHSVMMPENGIESLRTFDAIYLGMRYIGSLAKFSLSLRDRKSVV